MINDIEQIENDYFLWLYNYVCKGRINKMISYKKLFKILHEREFVFYIKNDINRARDGEDLRYRYSLVKHDENIVKILNGPCSVLEMLIALAIRCEETIMSDPRYGDRTNQWFWGMISTLGLAMMTDDHFDEENVNNAINRLLERQYARDGSGGLFKILNTKEDLRTVEIWTQLSWYLNNFN